MTLQALRTEIDRIDDELCALFERRMDVCRQVAEFKKANNLTVLSTSREQDIVSRLTEGKSDKLAGYIKDLYGGIFGLSRSYQNDILAEKQ